MEIAIRERSGVRILALVGKLAVGCGASEVYSVVRQELDSGHRWILLEMSRVTFLDSTGLGKLVACYTSASNRDAKVKILKPSPKVEDVLRITQMDRLFDIHHDEDEAIQSLQEP